MNRWDSLLGWLDERGATSWERVKTASMALSLARLFEHPEAKEKNWQPLQHAVHWAYPLIHLGHAEFIPATKQVCTCRRGIIWHGDKQKAVLYGYWREQEARKLEHYNLQLSKYRPNKGPSCWYVNGNHSNIIKATKLLGLWCSKDPGMAILERLPVLDKLLNNLPRDESQVDGNWEKLFFADYQRKWVSTSLPFMEPGLFRRLRGKRRHVLMLGDHTRVTLSSKEHQIAGIWSLFPSLVYRYDSKQKSFFIPAIGNLPLMILRALTTQSAQLPEQVSIDKKYWWRFKDVDYHKVLQVARIMGLDLDSESKKTWK